LFIAQVMPENHRMVDVFRDSGFAVTVRAINGMIEIQLPTSLSDEARQRFHEREQVAAVAAVRSLGAGSGDRRDPLLR
jgi:acetate---CoA ligase (ADP-forming)